MTGFRQERARLLDGSYAPRRTQHRDDDPPPSGQEPDLAPAQGLVNGLLISGLIWAFGIMLGRLLLH